MFPNFKNKHAQDSMFTAKEFFGYNKRHGRAPHIKAPEAIIICYSRALMQYIKKNENITEYDAFGGTLYLLNASKNRIGILGDIGIGSPAVGVALEEAIAFGTKIFISIGTAGTLQQTMHEGDVVLCSKAIRDEGTSFHYLKSSTYAYPSKELIKHIATYFTAKNIPYTSGSSWTIDAPYRETVAEAKKYQKEGVLTVEMEASALFAIAAYHQVQMVAIFIISDSLAELTWNPQFHHKKTKSGLAQLYRHTVALLSSALERKK